ncbi:MAG TPA: tRNA (adenosine(37)-N6)-threonylcarbamoyltransferase complex dimerization subunit type 1 TsaB [Burkholderiales bacterium]|nr:tRNA (adenosine(37)-N6)-threonylcarbamoyltransferase complex dimerization subunit type 1 TsaB [Burkholderiales bacterium]
MKKEYILAIETSTEYLSIALTNGEVVVVRDCVAGQKHSELVLPMIEDVLAEAGVDRTSLHAIAFGVGPGSFTGLRIACGVTQGLAFGLGLPVIAVSTLEAVAEATERDKVVVALDARMGEIYFAAFEREGAEWKASTEGCLCKPSDSPQLLGGDWYGAGSGFGVHSEALTACYTSQLIGVDAGVVPHAKTIVQIATRRFHQGKMISAFDAAPVYIRNKVALTIEEQAAIR